MSGHERQPDRAGELDTEAVRFVLKEARELIRALEGTATSQVTIRAGGVEIHVRRAGAAAVGAGAAAAGSTAAAAPAPTPGLAPIVAPLVGVFYRAPSPGDKPFVEVGDTIERGQPVAIIEAMKIMTKVTSDQAGTVAEVLVEDGAPVQYEQPLILVDTGGATA